MIVNFSKKHESHILKKKNIISYHYHRRMTTFVLVWYSSTENLLYSNIYAVVHSLLKILFSNYLWPVKHTCHCFGNRQFGNGLVVWSTGWNHNRLAHTYSEVSEIDERRMACRLESTVPCGHNCDSYSDKNSCPFGIGGAYWTLDTLVYFARWNCTTFPTVWICACEIVPNSLPIKEQSI